MPTDKERASEIEVVAVLSRSPCDPSAFRALLESWLSEDALGLVAPRLTALVNVPHLDPGLEHPRRGWSVVPSGWAASVVTQAFDSAARAGRHLLCLSADLVPSADAVGALLAALEEDPHFGAAVPRLETPDGLGVFGMKGEGGGEVLPLSRAVLSALPSRYIVPEGTFPCALVRWELLANVGECDEGFASFEGALKHYLYRARRCGFRSVVANRVTVRPAPARACSARHPGAASEDEDTLRALCAGGPAVRAEYGIDGFTRYERLLGHVGEDVGSRPLLLDARNLDPVFNGTAQAILGIADGLHAAARDRRFDLWVRPESANFHGVTDRYPGWRVHRAAPDRNYVAALRLSQPWSIAEMIDLHRRALINVYTMLDTIAWDTVYPAPPGLDGCWRFAARYADGFAYISDYTRDRFLIRFPQARRTAGLVTHLSCDPAEYARPLSEGGTAPPFWLVIGNRYDHKNVDVTTRTLTQAFPFQEIVALGAEATGSPTVRIAESGRLSESEVHALYARASLVIYPSLYEGFGFPLVTALSYGRTVLARDSGVLTEVASLWTGGGRIVPFRTPLELVEVAGRIRHGLEVDVLPLGSSVRGDRPHGWRDTAAALLGFVDDLSRYPGGARWIEREEAISYVLAYRG